MTRHLGNLSTIEAWEREEGAPAPLGATWVESEQAWNFSLYSRAATSVTLLIYGADDVTTPILQFAHDPLVHKTGRIWHCMISAARVPGATYYAYKVDGPSGGRNHFVPAKVLCDPYAHRLHFPAAFSREAARGDGPNDGMAVLGRLPRASVGRGAGPAAGPRHTHDTVIYEAHVKGFTARENSGVTPDAPGHLQRADREDPLPDRARGHRPRAAPRAAVRPPGGQLLGVHDHELLRPAPRLRRSTTRWPSSATWSTRCTRPASRCGWTWSTTTPARGTRPGRPTTCGASTTTPTTSSPRTARTWTTPGAATPRREPTWRCGRWCCAACGTGRSRASTGSGSTWRRSWPGTPTGRSTRTPPRR